MPSKDLHSGGEYNNDNSRTIVIHLFNLEMLLWTKIVPFMIIYTIDYI